MEMLRRRPANERLVISFVCSFHQPIVAVVGPREQHGPMVFVCGRRRCQQQSAGSLVVGLPNLLFVCSLTTTTTIGERDPFAGIVG